MTAAVRHLDDPAGLELDDGPVYLRPVSIEPRPAPEAAPLAGGPTHFHAVEVITRRGGEIRWCRADLDALSRLPVPDLERRLRRLTEPRASVAGIAMNRPRVMGIVNVTPDSFSDGGRHADSEQAVAHGLAMVEAGADLLDVGGESTRPGSDPVPVDEEIRRTEPVVRALTGSAPVSIDSRNAAAMAAAIDAGAALVNDVSALRHDPAAMTLLAGRGVPVALMHMLGEPKTMQADPRYDHAPLDVYDMLETRVEACEAAGIPRSRILVDPGFGFGKTPAHNMAVTDWLALYHGLGCPILFGASRKSSIAAVSRGEPTGRRLGGSIALALAAAARGVQMIRVHDVAETTQALAVWRAVQS